MKCAFLFLTIGELRQNSLWKQFFREENQHQYTIYNHAKYPDRISSKSLLHQRHIAKHISTQWAHNSLVHATVNLLQAALEDTDNQWFLLCSESCIPIIPFVHLYSFLEHESSSFLCFNPNYTMTKDCEKRYLRFTNKTWIPPHKFMKADQWFILNRQAATVCAQGHHIQDFDRVFASDEHYFINILHAYGIPFKNRWSTFTDHEYDRCHPIEFHELSLRFIEHLQEKGFFFLRKVSSTLRFIS